jgi:hypothetical protein
MSLGDREQIMSGGIALLRAVVATPFTQVARGLASAVTRTAAGIYVVTLAQGIPASNCRTIAFLYAGGVITVVHTSDTVKTVTTSATIGGAAADVGDFDVAFEQLI